MFSVRGIGTQWRPSSSQHVRFFSQKPLFDKILIANRGEIACRVIRTAKRMGIKTVAVYSTPDMRAKHVQMADEAVHVGGALSSQSYLNQDNLLAAMKKTGAQAVHPGYGFLSENSGFAKRLEENGYVFIGPTSHAISAMGDKIESKKLATKAGVNVIPGKLADVNSVEEVIQIAKEIGYPVMIKASAGGGGKGMRIAWNDREAEEGFALAKQEAKAAFGDDRILIEKFVDNPRHIEIQVLADSHGKAVYLNERECSIQRRNQKVLEEAPSSFLDEKTRKAMGAQAVALATAVKYRSAGTVEFLVDSQKNFYFLEMNTRLQVEHPVTEYITGLDLVEEMIKVAAGQPLGFSQEQVQLKGHAMEARVYAEDPLRNFLPSIGFLESYVEPTSTDNSVRVDSGVREGDEISIYYDPLISKLVTYGKDRSEAIRKMGLALDQYVIRGVNHNVCFLRSMMEHPKYQSGAISTKFIPQEFPNGFHGHTMSDREKQELIVSAAIIHYARARDNAQITDQLESYVFPSKREYVVGVGKDSHKVVIEGDEDDKFTISLDGSKVNVQNFNWTPRNSILSATINKKDVTVQLFKQSTGSYKIQHVGTLFDVTVRSPKEQELFAHMPVKQLSDNLKVLLSPMPGRVISINVKPGDKVAIGQPLAVVEAMKMQNVLRAERDGIVKNVKAKQGSDVAVDEELIAFE